jgi:hypothetical protein
MNARNFFAELKRRNVSESRADDLAGGTKQRPPDWLGVGPLVMVDRLLRRRCWSLRALVPLTNGPRAGRLHYQRVEDNAFHLRLSGAIDSAATNSRSQWVIFEAAFMTSACTTGIMSAMYAPNFCIADFPTGEP